MKINFMKTKRIAVAFIIGSMALSVSAREATGGGGSENTPGAKETPQRAYQKGADILSRILEADKACRHPRKLLNKDERSVLNELQEFSEVLTTRHYREEIQEEDPYGKLQSDEIDRRVRVERGKAFRWLCGKAEGRSYTASVEFREGLNLESFKTVCSKMEGKGSSNLSDEVFDDISKTIVANIAKFSYGDMRQDNAFVTALSDRIQRRCPYLDTLSSSGASAVQYVDHSDSTEGLQ